MTISRYIALAFVSLTAFGTALFLRKGEFVDLAFENEHPSKGIPVSFEDLPEKEKSTINFIKSIYEPSILLHGLVQDEQGNVILGALVEYTLNDKFLKDGTKGTASSGLNGQFVIKGNGASVYLNVQKEGYYRIPDRSYGEVRANQATSVQSPAVLVLKKAGKREQLLRNTVRRLKMPVDSSPVEINLAKGNLVGEGDGHLKIEVWVVNEQLPKNFGYEWKCRISVPQGGILRRNSEFDFEAPRNGYQTEVEFSMPAKSPEKHWTDSFDSMIFLQLPDGTFARGNLYLSTDNDRALISFDSWWNQSGSRNLEAGANDFGKAY